LDKINLPQAIRNLTLEEKKLLAQDVRNFLINQVSVTGGHLAANLGVVELTIVIQSVFNTAKDRIIWDVGHQSYVHKILTGRYEKMPTLRQWEGLSGFPKSKESIHDAFDTGHSSTSVSAAVGLALARDANNENYSVAAVIGDGALTGGMAFEALNHAGQEALDILVILNDNEMSISRNVGAMSAYLNRLRTDPHYARTKGGIDSALNKIPVIGHNMARLATWFKDKVKYLMVPGVLFEELGFTYIGPVDGHDIQELTRVLSNTSLMKGPVLVHAITQKGRGYGPASKNPDRFHGVGPFDVETGLCEAGNKKSYTEIFGDFMVARAEEDPKLVAITAAMASGTGLNEFARKYPERFFDVGICEQHAVTMAAGMAKGGLRPVVAFYSTFSQRAFDQILHDVALQNLPVVFALDRAGLVGEDGPTHHGIFDLAFLRIIPNLTIMAPSNENEFADMLYTALNIDGPAVIRYPRGNGEGVPVNHKRQRLEIGRAKMLKKGEDLAIIAIGRAVGLARAAGDILNERGINAALVDARFAKPLDTEMLKKVAAEYDKIVFIEEGCLAGGFGSAGLENISLGQIKPQVLRLGIHDNFVEHGKTDQLFEFLQLDPAGIADTIMKHWDDLKNTKPARVLELLKFGQN
jgi:1-deoxy-D-xylulose-5-phosphate synthase